jgi:hypothetical protein
VTPFRLTGIGLLAAALLSQTGCGISAVLGTVISKNSGSGGSSSSSVSTPRVTSISPAAGSRSGGVIVTITGSNFPSDATVVIGGVLATNVLVANSGSLTATTVQSSANGVVDVTVTNPNGGSGTLPGAFTLIPEESTPSITIAQPGNDAFEVAVSYTVADSNLGDTLTVTGFTFFDVNAGTNGPATIKSGVPAAVPQSVSFSSAGTTHTLVWDSFADVGYGNNRLVQLSLTVADDDQTVTATTGTFFVSNGPLSEADITGIGLTKAVGFASGDLDGDGFPDLVASGGSARVVTHLRNSGQIYEAPSVHSVVGEPTALAEDLTWSGSTTVAHPGGTSLQLGDWIGLPYDGDPIGPRFFRISAVNAGNVVIEDPLSYGAGSLLPGDATLGGDVSGTGKTLVQRAIAGLGPGTDNLTPDFRPGQVAILSADADTNNDVVVLNSVPALLATALTAGTAMGGNVITVASLAPGTPPQAFEVGMQIKVGTEFHRIASRNLALSQLTLVGTLGTAKNAGDLVFAQTSGNPAAAGGRHASNHAFTVLPANPTTGHLGAPTQTTASGGLYPQDAIAGDVFGAGGAHPAGAAPDGIPDLVVVNAASINPATPFKGNVTVFVRNNAGAGFETARVYDIGQGVTGTPAGSVHGVIADVTSNTRPDVIVANAGESTVSVLSEDPMNAGEFKETIIDLKISPFFFPAGDTISVGVADLNQDGFPDLCATGVKTQRIVVLRGADPDGMGGEVPFPGGNPASPTVLMTQSPAPPALVAGSASSQPAGVLHTLVAPRRIAICDFNSDGRDDVAVPQQGNNRVTLFLNQGTTLGVTSFTAVELTPSLAPDECKNGDVSGDGRSDLLAFSTFTQDVARFHQSSPGTLDQIVSFPVGTEPASVKLVELTASSPGLEAVVTNNGQDSITVLGQNGTGGLVPLSPTASPDISLEFQTAAKVVPQPYASNPRTILPFVLASADFNMDGAQDLAVSMQFFVGPGVNNSGCVDILLNMGGAAPIQTVERVLIAQRTTLSCTAGQFVGALGPDVAIGNNEGGTLQTGSIQVYSGTGDGGFLGTPLAFDLAGVTVLTASDLDGDGDLDILAGATVAPPNFFLLRQEPAGTLLGPVAAVPGGITTVPGITTTSYMVAADFNNDGHKDVLMTDFLSSRLAIAFQDVPVNVPPTYSTVVKLLTLPNPIAVDAGDLNSDGLADVVVSFASDDKVGIYYQLSGANKAATASLDGPIFLDSGPGPGNIAIGDLNGDGRNDVAVCSRGANTLNVLFQR